MNICFVALSYPPKGEPTSGVGAQVRVLAEGLIAAGHSVHVVALGSSNATRYESGIEVHEIRCGNLHWYVGKLPLVGRLFLEPVRELEYSIAALKGVRSADKTHAVDLIEGSETGMLFLAMLWRRSPVVIRLHGEQYTFHKYTPGMRLTVGVRLARVLQRMALRRAKLLISPSRAHAVEIQHELNAELPIAIVPNSVTFDKVQASSIDRVSEPNIVLYVGRIERRKGIATLLKAAEQVGRVLPNVRFVFAGAFHKCFQPAEFHKLVEDLKIAKQITVLGAIGYEELTSWYQRSALVVLPSHYETFGLAAVEPMTFGKPVVVARGGALPEVVEDGVTGLVVDCGDASALAAAIIELLNDPKTCSEMGKAAIQQAAKFDVRNVLQMTERVYRWCCEPSWKKGNPHVFFAPHPDDAVFSCGGTIHSLISRGQSVQVITVFAAESPQEQPAFSRHLYRKWRLLANSGQRRKEDCEALRALGVKEFSFWNYVEAPERRAPSGQLLYASYDEMLGKLASADKALIDQIVERISSAFWPADSVFYFPLSLGQHVDHQILFAVGHRLLRAGKHIRFYEDFPYAQNYRNNTRELNWLPQIVSVPIEEKLKVLTAYTSQLHGLGGSVKSARKRLRRFSNRFDEKAGERYWKLVPATTENHNGAAAIANPPLALLAEPTRPGALKKLIRTFRWNDLEEILSVGAGYCADIGSGNGRHKDLIEKRGYEWTGIDLDNAADVRGDATTLPLRPQSQAAVVAWQVIEYVDDPPEVFAEAARVLEPGGLFCGSVSFLEPVHGGTYFNLSPLIVEKLLRTNGFGDITIRPGLNGFALMLWTYLRRLPIPQAAQLALPLTFLMFAPLAVLLFSASWILFRLGFGGGHLMRWVTETAPLEFAGHIMFSARKRARI